MKGVISSITPDAHCIDLCHEVPPLNVAVGGIFLKGSRRYFPGGTVFVAVIDPSVGTDRKAIILKAYDQLYLGPDNGLLWPVIQRDVDDPDVVEWQAVSIENRDLMMDEISDTFHGRDIFAPCAAHILKGTPIEDFGPPVEELTPLEIEFPELARGEVHGKIIHIDHFGNAWTNIHRSYLDEIGWFENTDRIVTRVASCKIKGIRKSYLTDRLNKPLVLINSFGLVEIAWPGSSAKEKMHLWEGVWVDLSLAGS
jgi:S-adenosylmethionine hydrolase